MKARIQRTGFRSAIREALGTLSSDRFEVWKLSLQAISGLPRLSASEGVLVGPKAMETLQRCRELTTGLPVEFYRDEIDKTATCALACHDGRAAAIAWPYRRTNPGHFLNMSSGEAEIRSVYSLPEFRGHGLAKAVIAAACDALRRDGVQDIYAVIHFRNEPSQRAFRAIGFTKIAELRRRPLFGPRFVTASGTIETWSGALARTFRLL